MTKVTIDNKIFGYHIYPRFGKVYVEIYYTGTNDNIEICLLTNEFGSTWWKLCEQDYIEAKIFAENQLKYIENANK